ncbi:transcriptional regulator [Burkholderia sp. Bp9031]|uniref:ATP-binding protein n=1 Tax=Burkholderia sp. Bp9031 TaxID=2184566 RepID=UPI000F5DDA6D|nr:winged helix-turn-helix domain-containing protein [Burkholderia sp. Bp9031]RQZ19722.1 transcriptional regulator [Burkholderia sp. Bp9031]
MIRIGTLHVFLDRREILSNGKPVRIGSRAFEILELLIRADGALVSKNEIMERVWPHTVVEENNLQVHIAALRKALADDRDLIVTVPGRGYRLVGGFDEDPQVTPSVSSAVQDDGALSLRIATAPNALIGRQHTVADVIAALDGARVVTLVGSGGIGKTRVAIEAATQAAERFPDGVVLVSLAAVSDPRFVLDSLAAALGIAQAAGSLTIEAVVTCVAGRRLLIVLDNCEHLIDACAQVADVLTAANAGLSVLATSREALRVNGERLRPIPPLDVPSEDEKCSGIMNASSVQLFVARARASDPRFPLDQHSLSLTASICRHLDGLPLAIELAAARAAVLGLKVLAANLDDHFRLLTGGFRTALPRHQTLRAMYDWSYRLLDDAERQLLRWLGVFRDSFSLDAVRDIIDARDLPDLDLLDAIAGLVSKSLVIFENTSGGPRYRLLATTRAYALQQLENNGECRAAARAHAHYFLTLFKQAPADGTDGRPLTRLDAVHCELGNLRAALDWAFSSCGDRRIGVALAAVAVPCLFDLSLVDECRERARAALDATQDPELASVSADTRMRLLAAYAAALAHATGPVHNMRDAWSEVHAVGLEVSDDSRGGSHE